MAINAIKKLAADWYTPECEQGEDNPTQFELKPLDGIIAMRVLNDLYGSGPELALQHGLVGWRNFNDPENGREIKFSRTNFNKVPATILSELSTEIINRSELGAEEVKNS